MKPTRIVCRDFGSYEQLDLRVPAGATACCGANGAGKSTLLSMVAVGVFAERGELAGYLRHGADRVEVTVEVDHAGERYRVRRGAGRKPYLDFERRLPPADCRIGFPEDLELGDSWEPLSLETTAATQARINETFGLTNDTFRASAFLSQNGGSFAGSATRPAERMALFSSLLGLHLYEQLAAQAHVEALAARADLATLKASLADAREQLEALPDAEHEAGRLADDLAAAEARVKVAQAALDHATEAYQQAREQTAAVETARATLAAAEAEHRRLGAVQEAADRARFELVGADGDADVLRARVGRLDAAVAEEERLRAEVEGHRRAVAEHRAACAAQAAAADRVADLERQAEYHDGLADLLDRDREQTFSGERETCRECGQTLGHDASIHAAARIAEQMQFEREKAESYRTASRAVEIPVVSGDEPEIGESTGVALGAAQIAVRDARAAGVEVAALTERLAGLREKVAAAETTEHVAAMTAASEAHTRASLAFADACEAADGIKTAMIQQEELRVRARLTEAQQDVDHARTAKAHADQTLLHLKAIEQRIHEAAPREHELQERIDILTAAEQAHGRNGIPALILENRVPDIEAAANTILAELGGQTAGARIEIRTQREKAAGGVQDRLEVVLVTQDGHDQPYDRWSGGEQVRINLALRWALAGRTGMEFVVLDEPAALDKQGKTDFVALVDTLAARGATVLVVAHDDEIRESFAQVLEVVNEGGRSRVLGADREQVAA